MKTASRLLLSISSSFFLAGTIWATETEQLIFPIQKKWAEIKYEVATKDQAELFKALALDARKVSETHPGSAEPLIWEGIVISSEAGVRSGLSALSLAKNARDKLLQSIKINDQALNGSAYTSLATLYAKVPGWPIGFGDNDQAESYFIKSISINPNGIDPNYFYGEYLIDHGRHQEARKHLEIALKAPARVGRELADDGRRKEVRMLLDKLDKDSK